MSRRRQKSHANHERWLVSYADFITLLFAFFVVLYASSQVDKHKMSQLAAAIEGAFTKLGVFEGSRPGPPVVLNENSGSRGHSPEDAAKKFAGRGIPQGGFDKASLEEIRRELEHELGPELRNKAVVLRTGHEGLIISLSEIGFFDSGSAVMRASAEESFARIVAVLARRQLAVRIEGHTDNIPIHTAAFRNNWELSTARATGLILELVERYHFAPEHLSAAGYAEFHPVASNETELGRQQNRRVDLVVLSAGEAGGPESPPDSAGATTPPSQRDTRGR